MSHPEIDDADIDDALLVKRIKNIVMGDCRPDPEDETVEEQPKLVLGTILRQIETGNVSHAALGYLAHCIRRSLSDEATSLDEAFYMKWKRAAGGQRIAPEVERRTVVAYMQVIRKHTWKFDAEIGCEIYLVPSKAVQREALQAAFEAYRDAVGKDHDEFGDPEKKINQTIKPLLERKGVLM